MESLSISFTILQAFCGHFLIEAVQHAIILSKICKVPFLFKEEERDEIKEHVIENTFEYSVDNDNLSEKTEISSNPTNAVSTSDYVKEVVTAELVLSSLVPGYMELQERKIPEEENIDETLELLPELLDKSTELEALMDLERIDSQANTNDLKTLGEIFEKLKNGEIYLTSACPNGVLKITKYSKSYKENNSHIKNSEVMADVSRYYS